MSLALEKVQVHPAQLIYAITFFHYQFLQTRSLTVCFILLLSLKQPVSVLLSLHLFFCEDGHQ